ncbi:hypothetical protein H310_08362 [Aphanomyces invadans]|uniref:Uncharacterized protein n=1 Tax=Aphanomyces invadans TaxID=157072 RepID=A0A024TXX9_9STRA|nr:hypothetical protein H310_08362 [Aphanomyces invadans]ETV98863.1 hypothetical protein H310_08362 [Aphanomyces invadans]|eukprot:XP_008872291.1 hypothetical protein H310_08362 [Aphanomyces invadans]
MRMTRLVDTACQSRTLSMQLMRGGQRFVASRTERSFLVFRRLHENVPNGRLLAAAVVFEFMALVHELAMQFFLHVEEFQFREEFVHLVTRFELAQVRLSERVERRVKQLLVGDFTRVELLVEDDKPIGLDDGGRVRKVEGLNHIVRNGCLPPERRIERGSEDVELDGRHVCRS